MALDIVRHHQALSRLMESQTPVVIVTLLVVRGSAPQDVGAKAIVTAVGLAHGTVGGGKIENAAIEHALQMLNSGDRPTNDMVTWNLQTDIGMTCGGEVKLFFEVFGRIDWHLAVFGAGHVAQALIPMLMQLQCHVTWIDPRIEWLQRVPDHPRLTKRCVEHPEQLVAEQSPGSFFVLINRGHATDFPVLCELLKSRQSPYIGVIGSLQKRKVLERELGQAGVDKDRIAAFTCPIGLSIGNNSPAEIAISIVAQLLQQRDSVGAQSETPAR